MELFFRKYFWVVNLAFLLVAAFLSAKTVNTFVAASLAPLPDLSGPSGPAMPVVTQKTALGPEALSKVTGIELPKPEPEVTDEEPEPALPDVESQEAVKTG